jgi:L-ascorbate metabolism protein UlaG (beta-lactamase superfamily)
MDIKYIGHASFFIKTKLSRVVTDPFDPKIGLKFPKTEADIVTVSHHHSDHNFLSQITGDPLIIDWPGEFEKQQVRISGFSSFHDKQKGAERGENTLYKFETEGISILHCGDLGVVPDDNFINQIGEVDVLMVPVGGVYTIDANDAVDVIKK